MRIGSSIAKWGSRAGCVTLCVGALTAAPAIANSPHHSGRVVAHAADGHGDGQGNWQWQDDPAPPPPLGAAFTVSPGASGSPSAFDASGSIAKSGSITAYHWTFGDGTSADSTGAATAHVYASPGTYTATLTETLTSVVNFWGMHSPRETLTAAVSHAFVVPAPAPPPPPLPPPPPAVHVSTSPATVGPRGNTWIALTCPASAQGGCHGTITVQLVGGQPSGSPSGHARAVESRCARGCRALGSANYEARAGRKVRIRVHMASFARGLLARRHRLRVRLTVTSVAGARVTQTVATITLKARRHRSG